MDAVVQVQDFMSYTKAFSLNLNFDDYDASQDSFVKKDKASK